MPVSRCPPWESRDVGGTRQHLGLAECSAGALVIDIVTGIAGHRAAGTGRRVNQGKLLSPVSKGGGFSASEAVVPFVGLLGWAAMLQEPFPAGLSGHRPPTGRLPHPRPLLELTGGVPCWEPLPGASRLPELPRLSALTCDCFPVVPEAS